MSDASEHRSAGGPHMISVGEKDETTRRAIAEATLRCAPETVTMIRDGSLPKGDALATARLGGVMAAKRTPDIIPLCHPLPLTAADVTIDLGEDAIRVRATVECVGRTGVEMEALTAAGVAALTVYDMAKGVDRAMYVERLQLLEKSGGRSGTWRRDGPP